jgi:hypothetical protein
MRVRRLAAQIRSGSVIRKNEAKSENVNLRNEPRMRSGRREEIRDLDAAFIAAVLWHGGVQDWGWSGAKLLISGLIQVEDRREPPLRPCHN